MDTLGRASIQCRVTLKAAMMSFVLRAFEFEFLKLESEYFQEDFKVSFDEAFDFEWFEIETIRN